MQVIHLAYHPVAAFNVNSKQIICVISFAVNLSMHGTTSTQSKPANSLHNKKSMLAMHSRRLFMNSVGDGC